MRETNMRPELDFSYGITKTEYDAWVEEVGVSPTQQPIYNHSGGIPDHRLAPYIGEGVSDYTKEKSRGSMKDLDSFPPISPE